jgi:hypothetical protein
MVNAALAMQQDIRDIWPSPIVSGGFEFDRG